MAIAVSGDVTLQNAIVQALGRDSNLQRTAQVIVKRVNARLIGDFIEAYGRRL